MRIKTKAKVSACRNILRAFFLADDGQVEMEYILILFIIVLGIYYVFLRPMERILTEYYYANISFFLSLPFP